VHPYAGVPPYGYAPAPYPAPTNGMGIAGFVLGLLGLLFFWVPVLGLLLAGLGIALSGVGLAQGRRTGASTGLAVAGLVCGIVGVIPAFVILVAFASSPY
jgi:hypothetical protein